MNHVAEKHERITNAQQKKQNIEVKKRKVVIGNLNKWEEYKTLKMQTIKKYVNAKKNQRRS